MFEINFDDCGIALPDGKEIGSFDGTAFYENDSGMAILLDIELNQFDPEKKCFSKKMLNRFDRHEVWMLNSIGVSVKRRFSDQINEAMENEIASRRGPSADWLYANSAGRTL